MQNLEIQPKFYPSSKDQKTQIPKNKETARFSK